MVKKSNKKHTRLKHLLKTRQTTSHSSLPDSAAVSQHDSLEPVRSQLWSYAHVINNAALVDLMILWLMQQAPPLSTSSVKPTVHTSTAKNARLGTHLEPPRAALLTSLCDATDAGFKMSVACNGIEALAH